MKKFLLTLIAYMPIIVAICMVNYFVDPAHRYYRKTYEADIVKMLQHGNVANVDDNFDERRLKRLLAESCEGKYFDVLILGSSRSMLLSEKLLTGKTCLNLSVSGAVLKDEAALYYACRRNGLKFKQLFLLVDPHFFNESINNNFPGKALENDYQEYLKTINKSSDSFPINANKISFMDRMNAFLSNVSRKINILSITYFQEAIQYICTLDKQLYATDNFDNDGNTIHKDGSLSYNKKFRNQKQEDINEMARLRSYKGWDNYNELSKNMIEELETFINYVKMDSCEVLIFNSCYHPLIYEKLIGKEEYRCMKESMTFIPKLADLHDVKILGSFNPKDYGCDETCFYDGMHMNTKGINIILSSHAE